MSIKDETIARYKKAADIIDGQETRLIEYQRDVAIARGEMKNAESACRNVKSEMELACTEKLYLRGVLLELGLSEQQIDYEL